MCLRAWWLLNRGSTPPNRHNRARRTNEIIAGLRGLQDAINARAMFCQRQSRSAFAIAIRAIMTGLRFSAAAIRLRTAVCQCGRSGSRPSFRRGLLLWNQRWNQTAGPEWKNPCVATDYCRVRSLPPQPAIIWPNQALAGSSRFCCKRCRVRNGCCLLVRQSVRVRGRGPESFRNPKARMVPCQRLYRVARTALAAS
jgi:hypothetical protein